MSFVYDVLLIVGIRINEHEFPGNLWDDRWNPHIEGHQGIDVLIFHNLNKGVVYIGKIIASWCKGDDSNYFVEYEPNPEDCILVNQFLADIGIDEKSGLIFFVDAS